MGANIFNNSVLSVRKPMWTELGHVLENAPESTVEGFKAVGLNYLVHKVPLTAMVPTGGRPKSIAYPGRFALMREPVAKAAAFEDKLGASSDSIVDEWVPLGIVSDDYEPLQNMDIAEMLDRIGLPKKWPIETIGALGDGERIFVTFKAGTSHVLGIETEEITNYFCVTENRNGRSAMKIVFSPVRFVCQNTLNLGLKEATTTVNIAHTKGAGQRAEDGIKLMAGLDKSIKDTLQLFDKLAAFSITKAQAIDIIAAAYPQPSKPKRLADAETIAQSVTEFASNAGLSSLWATDTLATVGDSWAQENARIEVLRNDCFGLFNRLNDEHPKIANTGWAVVNAVVEHADWRDGPKGREESALWGARAKTKQLAMQATLKAMY